MLGTKHSALTRLKMSESHKGEKAYQWRGGKPNCLDCGKKLSARKYVRCITCRNRSRSGERCHLWKGGITPDNHKIRSSLEYRTWRDSVFARDDFHCKRCGKVGVYLHAHHICNFAAYPELRFVVDNGATLCKPCHKEFHDKYGRKRAKTNRNQLEEFLTTKSQHLWNTSLLV